MTQRLPSLAIFDLAGTTMQDDGIILSVFQETLASEDIFIETLNGEIVKVANPTVFIRCMYDVYCCHGETLNAIPLLGSADLSLNPVKSIVFPAPSDLLSQSPSPCRKVHPQMSHFARPPIALEQRGEYVVKPPWATMRSSLLRLKKSNGCIK